MKDGILTFLLVLLIGGWINLIAKRKKERKGLQKDTREILLERVRGKVIPVRRERQKATVLERTDELPQENNRSRMKLYSYHRKCRRSDKERRKSRVPVGITFEFIDRRQSNDSNYSDPERRSAMDRRGKYWDRRKPVAFQYT
jgi:hypothetical protein